MRDLHSGLYRFYLGIKGCCFEGYIYIHIYIIVCVHIYIYTHVCIYIYRRSI